MSTGPLSGVDLGFAGLLAEGLTPRQAWQVLRDMITGSTGAREVIEQMGATPQGRAALAWSREQWASYGLAPPWEEPEP